MNTQLVSLVELIKPYDYIYNCNSKDYKNKNLKQRAWNQIAKTLKANVPDIKKKWKNLRDRHKKQMKNNVIDANKKPWRYLQLLSFLSPNATECSSLEIDVKPIILNLHSPNHSPNHIDNAENDDDADDDNLDDDNLDDDNNNNDDNEDDDNVDDDYNNNDDNDLCSESNWMPNLLSIGSVINNTKMDSVVNPPEIPTSSSNYDKSSVLVLKDLENIDQEGLFALSVAGQLRELSKSDNFYAKMKIMEIFYNLTKK